MENNSDSLSRRTLLEGAFGTLAFAGLGLLLPRSARATEVSDALAAQEVMSKQVAEMHQQLETAADNYQKALEDHEKAKESVEEAQKRIDETDEKIRSVQERLSHRMVTEYKTGAIRFIDLVMNTNTFEEFATQLDAYEQLNDYDASLVEESKRLRKQQEEEKAKREEQERKAQEALEEAERIKKEAEETTAQLEQLLAQLSAEAQELIAADQAAALSAAESSWNVSIIGNPRDVAPHPAKVLEAALSRVGCPYVWAAAGPNTFDCSGLVVWSFAQAGVSGIPHYTGSLYELALSSGAVLPLTDVQPGDVLFRPGHCGIAMSAGGATYVHAPHTGAQVRTTDTLAYSRFVCGLRFKLS